MPIPPFIISSTPSLNPGPNPENGSAPTQASETRKSGDGEPTVTVPIAQFTGGVRFAGGLAIVEKERGYVTSNRPVVQVRGESKVFDDVYKKYSDSLNAIKEEAFKNRQDIFVLDKDTVILGKLIDDRRNVVGTKVDLATYKNRITPSATGADSGMAASKRDQKVANLLASLDNAKANSDFPILVNSSKNQNGDPVVKVAFTTPLRFFDQNGNVKSQLDFARQKTYVITYDNKGGFTIAGSGVDKKFNPDGEIKVGVETVGSHKYPTLSVSYSLGNTKRNVVFPALQVLRENAADQPVRAKKSL